MKQCYMVITDICRGFGSPEEVKRYLQEGCVSPCMDYEQVESWCNNANDGDILFIKEECIIHKLSLK